MSTFADQDWWKEKEKLDFSNLRIVPMDIDSDAELYAGCYRDGWKEAHGSLSGFTSEPYLRSAAASLKRYPLSLMKAFYGDDFAGIIELDTERMASHGAGWISFCYLTADKRGHNMGIQLIGHAVSVYRRLGRKSLMLHVAESNTAGIAFYDKLGFKCIGVEDGVLCPLKLMEFAL